ncbi:hypothetical protein [Nevskia ramosa]|uniref:hypothetical protein n=1 Tax=Nevskia ramosa TaxID=64002 RepID=UPI003D1116D0
MRLKRDNDTRRKWFKCFLAGHNFPGLLVNESQPVGFYTTRFVKASSLELAKSEVLRVVGKDKRLRLPEGMIMPPEAVLLIEEIVEIEISDTRQNEDGFVWYEMDTH